MDEIKLEVPQGKGIEAFGNAIKTLLERHPDDEYVQGFLMIRRDVAEQIVFLTTPTDKVN